jgi:uncharacterized protein YxjI
MLDSLVRDRFRVEELVAPLNPAFAFDVQDADSGDLLIAFRERPPRRWARLLRYTSYRRSTSFDLTGRTPDGQPVCRILRGVPVVVSHAHVYDDNGDLIGGLRQRFLSIGGAFDVLDATGEKVCRLQGRRAGTRFRLLAPDSIELARITKEWTGLGRTLLTSAARYTVEIDAAVPPDPILRQLILASAIGIGIMLKIELP